MDKLHFTHEEKIIANELIENIKSNIGDTFLKGDIKKLHKYIFTAIDKNIVQRDVFGLNPIIKALQTAQIAIEEIGLKRDGIIAIMLYSTINQQDMESLMNDNATKAKGESNDLFNEWEKNFGVSTLQIVRGLIKVHSLYTKSQVVESENFRSLLLSFAEDMRVILIMIAERVNLMRQIRDTKEEEAKRKVSEEASYLYAPLAHKLGLYKLKSELEDLSLKYLEHDAYYMIREKLNATKKSRDAYIERFIAPVQKQLEEAGLKFHMKGRTKSIHSIWQKMKKQQCAFEGIYDLFAIRIIIDSDMDETD
ncbi:MAG: bifunctional (p)ppGpp synthetase/guanosine-3',5'-bis(diphosphate) 3'-pyrophosphohydrolase, partial [Prevotella sp.]|nr:bifunctional (p)ppGpp synthetase/guanosine-3',5'-bis(diphosphate) 3'-pyrophosphohydrolase [Prevotella sp.]